MHPTVRHAPDPPFRVFPDSRTLLIASTLIFLQLGVVWQVFYSFMFFLYYTFKNLSFKNMERPLYRFTVLIQISDYFYIPQFISGSNWVKKMKTKSIVSTSLLCLGFP